MSTSTEAIGGGGWQWRWLLLIIITAVADVAAISSTNQIGNVHFSPINVTLLR